MCAKPPVGSLPSRIMDHFKSLLKLYYAPADAMSDLIDHGNWLFAAGAVLLVSVLFFSTVNEKLDAAYRIPQASEFIQRGHEFESEEAAKASYERADSAFRKANAERQTIPFVGDRFFQFFSFDPGAFYVPLLLLSVFYVPAAIMLMSFFGGVGSFGVVLRRDYGTLAVCTLSAWAAAHLPFAIAGTGLFSLTLDPRLFLAIWVASSIFFGVLMIFALRTVMGAGWGVAAIVISVAWLSLSLGAVVTQYVSPWLFSPFLIIMLVLYFGGSIGGEVRGFGNAMRQRQNLKRFLQNATVNPKDADAHVQLGLIYLQRRQQAKAIEHLRKALEIDENEIDANYEMGKIERLHGNLQEALNHFAVVVE